MSDISEARSRIHEAVQDFIDVLREGSDSGLLTSWVLSYETVHPSMNFINGYTTGPETIGPATALGCLKFTETSILYGTGSSTLHEPSDE